MEPSFLLGVWKQTAKDRGQGSGGERDQVSVVSIRGLRITTNQSTADLPKKPSAKHRRTSHPGTTSVVLFQPPNFPSLHKRSSSTNSHLWTPRTKMLFAQVMHSIYSLRSMLVRRSRTRRLPRHMICWLASTTPSEPITGLTSRTN